MGPVTILLVRHAEASPAPGVEPARWSLTDGGRAAARALTHRLPRGGTWVSSTAAKAHETLRLAAGDLAGDIAIGRDTGFDEVRREDPFDDGSRDRRRAWVAGALDERHEGWESPTAVAARFDEAVHRHRAGARAGVPPLVVGTHGMALTAWLVHARHTLDPADAAGFWEDLGVPDVVEIA